MQAALDEAEAARGHVERTAWVGAAVVRDGRAIARARTSPSGGMHAEAAALAAAGEAARGSELYTTLEPCVAFEGKRNPPCVDALIAAAIGRVIVAIEDADVRVRGRGIAALRAAGVEVEVGDGREAATRLLRPYLKQRQRGVPYVTAKFATSLDGRTATGSGDSKWITGEAARERAHQARALADAVLVGSGTMLADDPALTARPGGQPADRQPMRVVVDARGRTPPEARLFKEPGPTVIATSQRAPANWKLALAERGAQIIECESDRRGVNLDQLLQTLAMRGVMSVWAEGGGTLLGALLERGHVDEVWAFIAPVIVGSDGLAAIRIEGTMSIADALRLSDVEVELLNPDVLIRGYTGSWSPP